MKRRRDLRLAEVVERENARLQSQGLAWTLTPVRCLRYTQHMPMVLSWLAEVRPQWERQNPHRRPVSQEPLPPEFYSQNLKARIALAIMEQQAQAMGLVPNADVATATLAVTVTAAAHQPPPASAPAHIAVPADPGESQRTPGVSVTYAQHPPATPQQLPPPPYVSPPAAPLHPGMEWLQPGVGGSFLHPLCPPTGMASFCARCGVPRPSALARVCQRCGQLYQAG